MVDVQPVEVVTAEKSRPLLLVSSSSSTLNSDEPRPGEPLNEEAENILRGVPDFITDDGDGAKVESDSGGEEIEEDPIAALMVQITFEPQDVQDTLCEFFDWLAERFQSDHWRLTERQARMLGKPTTQLMVAMWSKLLTRLPDILAEWCASTPGAAAFLLAAGIVVVPKVKKQFTISRRRAEEQRNRVQAHRTPPVQVPVPARPTNGRPPVGVPMQQ